jgi:hypothetical protein
MDRQVNGDLLKEVGSTGTWFYRSLDPSEWRSYRRLVRRAGGRLIAVDAGGRLATLATRRVTGSVRNYGTAMAGDVAAYVLGQLLQRWGAGAVLPQKR